MSKKLVADGATGAVAIYEGGFDAAFTNPLANLNRVYFHSALDYVGVTLIHSGTIAHPARTASGTNDKYIGSNRHPVNGTQEWTMVNHNLGYVPHGILVVGNDMMPGLAPVQQAGSASARYVALRLTTTQAILREHWYTFNDNLPAANITYKIYLFTPPILPSGNKTLHITATTMQASRGKLNTDLRYVRTKATSPAFHLISGATADVAAGGLRMVMPSGTVINDGVYSGSFAGGGSRGCEI